MAWSFTPYRWEPVMEEGRPFRLTFRVQGPLMRLEAEFHTAHAAVAVPFQLGDQSAELLLPPETVAAIPDRAQARINADTGRGFETLARGHVTKREVV